MSSVLKKNEPKANLSRNGFNLSMRRMFSCPPGMLLPVFKDFALPGDKYKLNSSTFVRTEAIETAAFMLLKLHVDWFFVPIQQLYAFWNEFYNGTQDVMSSFGLDDDGLSLPTSYNLPTFNLYGALAFDKGSSVDNNFVRNFSTDVARPVFRVDENGIPLLWSARRLCDMLGYGSVSSNYALQTNTTPTGNWFPLYYLAYHKIFHSHFLNTDYFPNSPWLYNVDRYFGSSIPSGSITDGIISTIHYRPYRKDYFTDMQPAPVFNSNWVNAAPGSDITKNAFKPTDLSQDSVQSVSRLSNSRQVNPESTSDVYPSLVTTPGLQLSSTNNTNAIGDLRAMFALDRLLRITASTGSHYADQTLAHFGFSVPQGLKHEAYYLGSQVTDINISEVVASASTDPSLAGGTIGDIAGKGFGSTVSSKDIDFTCPSHGVIMALSSVEPIVDYQSNRPDIDNRYTSCFDFFHPELDNLGMVPLWDYSATTNYIGVGTQLPPIGWQTRYMESKIKYNVVNESMFDTHRSVWTGAKQFIFKDSSSATPSVLKPFNIFYIAPQYANNIFLSKVPYYIDGTSVSGGADIDLALEYDSSKGKGWLNPNLSSEVIYSSDNFLVNMSIKCFKTSVMSVHSLPKFL